jgi:hypothetical protein
MDMCEALVSGKLANGCNREVFLVTKRQAIKQAFGLGDDGPEAAV